MSTDSLGLLLKAFRLPTIAEMFERIIQEAEQQGWGYRRFLLHLCEAEAQDRAERKLERLLKESGLKLIVAETMKEAAQKVMATIAKT